MGHSWWENPRVTLATMSCQSGQRTRWPMSWSGQKLRPKIIDTFIFKFSILSGVQEISMILVVVSNLTAWQSWLTITRRTQWWRQQGLWYTWGYHTMPPGSMLGRLMFEWQNCRRRVDQAVLAVARLASGKNLNLCSSRSVNTCTAGKRAKSQKTKQKIGMVKM